MLVTRHEDPSLVQRPSAGGLRPRMNLGNKEQIAALLDSEDFAKLLI